MTTDPRTPRLAFVQVGGSFLVSAGSRDGNDQGFLPHRLDADTATVLCLSHRPGRTDRNRHRHRVAEQLPN